MARPRVPSRTLLFVSFLAVAAIQAWPLPANIGTALTGNPGGDTGAYVWNLWVFRHEILQGQWPFQTDSILTSTGPVDLGLHNYTVWANLVALPLQSVFDLVTTFNLVYLLNVALAGLGVCLLARRVSRDFGPGQPAAWLAGLLFACSPFLVARGTAHFSLVAAAALPFFVIALDRAWHSGRIGDAALVGLTLAWAAYSDPYYAIYCLVLAVAIVAGHIAGVRRTPGTRRPGRATRLADVGITLAALVVVLVATSPVPRLTVGPLVISATSLYTPVLVLTVLVVARLLLTIRPRIDWSIDPRPRPWVPSVLAFGLVSLVLLSPLAADLVSLAADGGLTRAPVLWRSSAPGVDLLSLVAPNPNHPLAPEWLVQWLAREPGQFEENVVSIPWVAMAVILAGRVLTGRWPSRLWLAIALSAASVTIGPFLRIAGVETYVPTPWALLRYVPILGEARMPARFGIILILAVAVLFAAALATIVARFPARRRAIYAIVGVALAAELWPVPRSLFSARIPAFYDTIAADPRPVSVLMLPVGVRDGLTSIGDFSALSQFYQTRHGKRLVGGYLSRVSEGTKRQFLGHPFLSALASASEGYAFTGTQFDDARANAERFKTDVNLGYVVIDQWRATQPLQDTAIGLLRLREVASDGTLKFYVPEETEWALGGTVR